MKYVLIVTFWIAFQSIEAKPTWGPTGHRTLSEIAEKHLSKKAFRKIQKILDGQSLAFVSTYADEIKSDKKYRKFSPWHYVNFPFNKTYQESKKSQYGDLAVGIETSVNIIKNPNSSKEEKAFYLKMLIHLIGDLHQPLHVGRAEDKGGNSIFVKWHGKKTNLHRVWDEDMIDSWGMSYTELARSAKELDKKQIKNIEKGSVADWINETQSLAVMVYQSAEKNENLRYKYSYDHIGLVRSQLQKGGIRLAKILNDLFS